MVLGRDAFQKANPHRRQAVLQHGVFKHMSVCERERRAERGKASRNTELRAQRWSLFSMRPLYLVSNISPGKRKHFSGTFSPPSCDLRKLLGHPGGPMGSVRGLRAVGAQAGRGGKHPPSPSQTEEHPGARMPVSHVRRAFSRGTPTLLRESSQIKGFARGLPWGSGPTPPSSSWLPLNFHSYKMAMIGTCCLPHLASNETEETNVCLLY